ncbi:MAG: hypothetical protein PHG02_03915 [Oscillospiraceae bacterium]|nr:hypothetical protein [Oscillospiraceae bacterium]
MFTVENGKNGKFDTVVMTDTTSGVTATLTPARGGMLTSFVKNNKEYMFINESNFFDEAIPPERPRCATPVLFPSVGNCANDTFVWKDKSYPMPQHGIVQHQAWKVIATDTNGAASVTLQAVSDEKTKEMFPFDYSVTITYVLQGSKITLKQTYANTGTTAMPFSYGFHPYFKVSDMRELEWNITADGIANDANGPYRPMPANIQLPYDAQGMSYTIFSNPKNKASFVDKADGRKLTVHFDSNFHHLILWCVCANGFICVEPWNTLPNTLNTNPANLLESGKAQTAEIAFEAE